MTRRARAALPSEAAKTATAVRSRVRAVGRDPRRARQGDGTRPSAGSSDELLAGLEIAVEDDAGTTYTSRGGNTGGSASEWHGDWFFIASVAESVERLGGRVSTPEGTATSVTLDVAAS